MNPFDSIVWDRDGGAIESESFRATAKEEEYQSALPNP